MKKYLLLLLAASSLTQAETFNVSTTPELRTALSTAATNGENDTIVLADGTYKTMDDDEGTFVYLSNEGNSITLKGSHADNVVLSGEGLTGVISFKSTNEGQISYLENISFVNGSNNDKGAGIYSGENLNIKGCAFKSNSSDSGAAIYAKNLNVHNTHFFDNSLKNLSNSAYGSAIYSSEQMGIFDSAFDSNTDGSVLHSGRFDITIRNSIFTHNKGDVLSSVGWGINISDSRFINDTANVSCITAGNAYYNRNSSIKNSIFVNCPISASSATVLIENSLFKNSNLTLWEIGNNIYNSIFMFSNINVAGSNGNDPILNIKNSYLDVTNVAINVNLITDSVIFDNKILGFVDEVNGDYNLTVASDLIDAGSSSVNTLDTDIIGNKRVVGGNIDIGPYEFSSTRPTINSVTYIGVAKEQSELTFITDYTLADGRDIDDVSYDFLNDGNYTSLNTYTYNTAGTYTIGVKVTDSEGEFSATTTSVTIAELPFSEMTYEQKLIKAISPEYYDLLISEIDIEKSESFSSGQQYVQDNLSEFNLVTQTASDTAVASATTSGITTGKQYVQDNLPEFSLVTEAAQAIAVTAATTTGIATGKQYVQDNLSEFSLVTEAAQSTAVTASNTSGIATGKQYVQDNLSEFSLVTQTASDTAVASATTTGIATGKQYVQDNLSEFSLVTEAAQSTAVTAATTTGITTGENNVINNPVAYGLNIVVGLSKEGIAQLPSGWKMISIPEDITDLSVFDGAKIVWFFNSETQAWTGYSSNTNTVQQMEDKNIGIINSLSAGDGIFIEM